MVLKRSREMVVVTTSWGFSAFAEDTTDKEWFKDVWGNERDEDDGIATAWERESVDSFWWS